MIKVNKCRAKVAGKGHVIAAEASVMLYAVCTQLANGKCTKYAWLEKIYSFVKKSMKKDDGIEEGDGGDA